MEGSCEDPAILCASCLSAAAQTPLQIYGAWPCSNDHCSWPTVRTLSDFDNANHWMIDRGDGRPSVNLTVLNFVNPLKLMNLTNDSETVNGIPIGMTSTIVAYFAGADVRVMFLMGGASYTSDWDTAPSINPTQLGLNAAAAKQFGVGMEIDYENDTNPNVTGLQSFIAAHRSQVPYDATGADPAARLTIDLGSGDTCLTQIAAQATSAWLQTANPVLDYANAMVAGAQYKNASQAEEEWKQHVGGTPSSSPAVEPLAPAKADGQRLSGEKKADSGVHQFQRFARKRYRKFRAKGGAERGRIERRDAGQYFLGGRLPGNGDGLHDAAEHLPGRHGAGATAYNIPIPMSPQRQK